MRVLDRIHGALTGFADLIVRGRQIDFTCADCDRWQRCGLPPSETCVARAAQIERDGGKPVRRSAIVASGAGRIYDR